LKNQITGEQSDLKFLVCCLSFLFLQSAIASASLPCLFTVSQLGQNKSLLIGSEGNFQGSGQLSNLSGEMNFLGISRRIDGSTGGLFFFDPAQNRIHYIPQSLVVVNETGTARTLGVSELEPVVRSINQEGGTCASYAMFNCFHQLYASNRLGNGMMVHHMENEASRQRFYTKNIMRYYGSASHVGAESDVAKALGYVTKSFKTSSPKALAESLSQASAGGWPSLLRFDVGKEMAQTSYEIFNHETQEVASRKLWLPTRDGRSSGGHQIMALRLFIEASPAKTPWLVVVDSNWQAPRLWRVSELNQLQRARIAGWTLSQPNPNPSVLPAKPSTPFLHDPVVPDLSEPTDF
jgi:hypothetical protein